MVSELNYEPRVILQHADRLNRRADSMGVTSAFIGALIGGFLGAMPLSSLGDALPIPSQFGLGTLLAGLLVGALTGYVIGDARAFRYRLQAQSSLCQLHLERNTAALLEAASYPGVSASRLEPPAAPVFEYIEPVPELEPASFVEVRLPEYSEPVPEPAPPAVAPPVEVTEPEPEPARLAVAPPVEFTEPEPEPAPLAVAPPVEVTEPAPEPVRFEDATPAPAPAPTLAPAPPALAPLAEAPLPDLDSLSLEEIAQLAKTGLI